MTKRMIPTALVLGALAAAPAADAKTKPTFKVSKGTTTLKLSPAATAALAGAGVAATADKPAKAVEGGFAFKVTNGKLTTSGYLGSIKHAGGLTLKQAATSKSLTLRNPIAKLAQSGSTLSVLVGEARVVIATLDASGATVEKTRTAFKATGVKATLTKAAADALNATFGTTLAEGADLGTLDVSAKVIGKGAKNKGPHADHKSSQGKSDKAPKGKGKS